MYDVVLLDDDREIRELVASVLEAMSLQVRAFDDGLKARHDCERKLPDLAVLDFMTPGMTGIELCSWLKGQPEGEFVPVIIVTAVDEVDNKVASLQAGAEDYLTKPFNVRELQARVNALLRVRGLHLKLKDQQRKLEEAQAQVVAQQRQLAAVQLAGTAAHTLGQPLTALKLNCHLLGNLPAGDEKHAKVLEAMKSDLNRMHEIIERLRQVDASKTEDYHRDTKVMKMEELRKDIQKPK